MATLSADLNEFNTVFMAEGAAPSTPGSGLIVAYAKPGGVFAWKDDGGTEHIVPGNLAAEIVFDPTGLAHTTAVDVQDALADLDAAITGGGGDVATDTIWNAAGDLAVGTGSDAAARLAIGAAGTILRSNGTTAAWATPSTLDVGSAQALRSLGTSTATGLAADRVYFTRYVPHANITVDTAAWNCATSAGNIDIGIYDEALTTKLGSTGAFSSPGTGNRTQALTGAVSLVAGTVYYLAFWSSNGSLRVPTFTLPSSIGFGTWNLLGIQSSVSTNLPSSITPTYDPGAVAYPIFWFLV